MVSGTSVYRSVRLGRLVVRLSAYAVVTVPSELNVNMVTVAVVASIICLVSRVTIIPVRSGSPTLCSRLVIRLHVYSLVTTSGSTVSTGTLDSRKSMSGVVVLVTVLMVGFVTRLMKTTGRRTGRNVMFSTAFRLEMVLTMRNSRGSMIVVMTVSRAVVAPALRSSPGRLAWCRVVVGTAVELDTRPSSNALPLLDTCTCYIGLMIDLLLGSVALISKLVMVRTPAVLKQWPLSGTYLLMNCRNTCGPCCLS